MVLDSSAIVAIHLREPGYEGLIDRIDAAEVVVVGVPTLLESVMVLTARLGYDARPMIFAFLRRLEAEVVPFNQEHLDAAATAFIRFGRGRHPAALNFGGLYVVCHRIGGRHAASIHRGRFQTDRYRTALETEIPYRTSAYDDAILQEMERGACLLLGRAES